jgi:hypothetical protein
MNQMFSRQNFVIALVCFMLGGTLGAMLHKETIVVRPNVANTPAALTSVDLMVDDGTSTIKTWNTVSWHETMSVLGLLETVSDAKAITLLTKDTGNGNIAVESINGIANDKKTGMRWQYWVNNTYEPRIASLYYLKPGDIVSWKYTKEQPK